MPAGSDGGKWALAGFLYQMLGMSSIVARALNLLAIEHSAEWDEVDGLVGLMPVGDGIRAHHEHLGQDAVFTTDDGYVLAQFKYSATGRNITEAELGEIIQKLDDAAGQATSQRHNVTACVLVTNRGFASRGGSARQRWETERASERNYQLRHWVVPREQLERDLHAFGARYGLFAREIETGMNSLIGLVLRATAQPSGASIGRDDVVESFTGCPEAKPLTLEALASECHRELQEFGRPIAVAQWNDTPIEREVFREIVEAVDQRALVSICGGGGCGKSVILWEVLKQLLDRPAGSCMASAAVDISDSWVTNGVHKWRNLPPGRRPGDDREMVIRRLHIANSGLTKYVLLLALDGLDERVRTEQSAYIRELIRWFWWKDAECQQSGQRPAATLVVSCRRRDELARRWLRLPPDYPGGYPCTMWVGDFSVVERRKAARAVSPELDRLLASVDGDAMMRQAVFYSSVVFDDPSAYRETAVLDSRVVDSLNHPVMWRALLDLAPSDQLSAVRGDSAAVGLLAEKFVGLFTWKITLRHPTLENMDADLLLPALRSVALHTTGKTIHSRADDWARPARATGLLTEPEALALYDEALSAGLIAAEADGSWRWRHVIVHQYLVTDREAEYRNV